MNPIVQMILIVYLFLAVPFLFGILATCIFHKEQMKMSDVITDGYLLMFASFWLIGVVALKLGWPLKYLAVIWAVVSVAVSLLALLFGRRQMKACFSMLTAFWGVGREENEKRKMRYGLLVWLAVLVVVSILFVKPSLEDATLEIVQTAVSTDTMYVYDAYDDSISASAMEGHAYSPIEMLYAVGASLTGISVPIMLHYMIPVCLLFLFYMVLWRMGDKLFEEEEKMISFVVVSTAIYGMTTYLKGQSVVTGIFSNCWNGLTLLSCIVMPAVFAICLEVMRENENNGVITHKIEKICTAIVLLSAGQLTNAKGGFYVALMLFVTIAVIIVRKGYDYVITSGRFKKRV